MEQPFPASGKLTRSDDLFNVYVLGMNMEIGRHCASGDTSIRIEEDRYEASFRTKSGSLFLGIARGRIVVHFLEVVEDLGMPSVDRSAGTMTLVSRNVLYQSPAIQSAC